MKCPKRIFRVQTHKLLWPEEHVGCDDVDRKENEWASAVSFGDAVSVLEPILARGIFLQGQEMHGPPYSPFEGITEGNTWPCMVRVARTDNG